MARERYKPQEIVPKLRQVAVLPQRVGWVVNDKRVERVWAARG